MSPQAVITMDKLAQAYLESGLRHWRAGQKKWAANEWAKAGRFLAALKTEDDKS